jgi:MFS transporter, DHA3 family, tetracycline resistance protein
MAPMRTWMVYQGVWSFASGLSWTTAVVYFLRDVHMTPLELVLAGTALELSYFVFEVPTGVVADLYSRKLSMVASAILSGAAMVLIGAVPDVAAVLVGMAVWGLAWTFRSGAEDAWLADEVGPALLGQAYQRAAQVGRLTGLAGVAAAVALALVDLRLPFVVAGATAVALGGVLILGMTESPRPPAHSDAPATMMGAARETVRQGTRLVRRTPALLLMLLTFVLLGAFSEGFDRLWEAQLLLGVTLPALGPLGIVGWFGLLGAATLVLSFALSAPLVRRVEGLDLPRLARLLLQLHAVLMVCALGFALAGNLAVALSTYLATTVVRNVASPALSTWLNGSVPDSTVRATVLSIASISGSLGEWTGGPALGAVGTRFGIRTALASGALLLAPTLPLFARAVHHHGVEPKLAAAADPGPTPPL